MKTWRVSSLDEETVQGEETIQGRKHGTLIYAPDLNDKKENLCLHRVACKKNKGVTNHKNLIRAFEPDGNTKNEY